MNAPNQSTSRNEVNRATSDYSQIFLKSRETGLPSKLIWAGLYRFADYQVLPSFTAVLSQKHADVVDIVKEARRYKVSFVWRLQS